MNTLLKLITIIDNINEWVGKILSLGIWPILLLVTMEVIARYVFNSPTVWGSELTQLFFGIYSILAGGYILKYGEHVNVDLIHSRLSNKSKAICNIITFPIFFLFTIMMLIYGSILFLDSLEILEHTPSAWGPPIYPFKLLVPVGALLVLLQGFSHLMKDIILLIKNNH